MNRYGPRRAIRPTSDRLRCARSAVDERSADLQVPEDLGRLFDRIALPDRAQVDSDAFSQIVDGEARFIQLDQIEADDLSGRGDLIRVRHLAGRADESPGAEQRRHGDVEGAVRLRAQTLRRL